MSCRILIAFYSRNGSVEALARAIAGGAEAGGAEVRLRRARSGPTSWPACPAGPRRPSG